MFSRLFEIALRNPMWGWGLSPSSKRRNNGIHTTCLYLFEALSGFYASSHPRLCSLRSLSLGLLKVCLFEALIADMLPYIPRLRSLRSLSLGLSRVRISEAINYNRA